MYRVILKDRRTEYVNVAFYGVWEESDKFIKLCFEQGRDVLLSLDEIAIIEPYVAIDYGKLMRELSKKEK